MASYNELNALIDAYINRNGVQAITGQILNGVLKMMVEQLGRGYTIMGVADPTTDPGTPDAPESYFASQAGTYTKFGGIAVASTELCLLCYTPGAGWDKRELFPGIQSVNASIDEEIPFPSVDVTYNNGVLSFDFHSIIGDKGDPGTPADISDVFAQVDANIGTPSVDVTIDGPSTGRKIYFNFHNLKGETGVTSVLATVDNTVGTPQCAVSLVGQQLTLAFSGLKGAQGDTGSSVDYPFTIVNNLTTDDATQALSAAQGVVLDGKISQLQQKVDGNLMSARAKNALIAVFQKVAFTVPDVSAEMSELNNALFNLDEVTGINAVYTQGSTIIWSDGVSVLNDLKANLVVKAEYGDGTEVNVTNYTLSGALTTGTSVVTVEYEGFTTTFNVTVTEYGSKMTYTMAEGSINKYPGQIADYASNNVAYTGISNFNNTNTRRVFVTNFGVAKMKNGDGSAYIDVYPIKIPRNAKSVTLSISGSNQQIAARVVYYNGIDYMRGIENDATYPYTRVNYTTGGASLDLSAIMGRSDTYLFLWGQRVSSASYVNNEPTAISVTFISE